MKRILFASMLLLALLVSSTGTAFAGSALELVSVQNNVGGVTFVFRVTGEFSKAELESGFVSVEGGEDFPLYCVQKDADTVVCETTDRAGGQSVVVGFGGARFWVDVPEEYVETFCYTVYDWNYPPSSFNTIDHTGWESQGEHCPESAAQEGDLIWFLSPNWGATPYEFWTFGVDNAYGLGWANPGQGYYFYSH